MAIHVSCKLHGFQEEMVFLQRKKPFLQKKSEIVTIAIFF